MFPSISRLFSLYAAAIIFLCLFMLGAFWLYDEYRRTLVAVANIKDAYIESNKNATKGDIKLVLRHIEYNRDFMFNKAKEDIKQRVYEAHAIANAIYNKNRDKKGIDEIKEMVKDALRYQRFNNRGSYFAANLNGIVELLADRPNIEGKDLLHSGDPKTNRIMRDKINIAKTKGEGYYEYLWSKPGDSRFEFKKLSYIKYFAPFNWFIGIGEYLDEIESEIQRHILQWIKSVRTDIDDYIFVFDRTGRCLSHIDNALIGTDMIGYQDSQGKFVVKDILETVSSKEDGFVSYRYKRPSDGVEADKVSYVAPYDRFGWVIGKGFYTEALASTIKERQALGRQRLIRNMAIMSLIMLIFFFSVIALSRIFSKRLQEGFDSFKGFFEKNPDMANPIPIEGLRYREFRAFAGSINRIIEEKAAVERDLDETRHDYKDLFDNMIDGFAIHEMIFDDLGNPKDYRFLAVNRAFEKCTGLKAEDIVGKTVLEVMPETEKCWIDAYGMVVITGEPIHFENISSAIDKYFEVTAYRNKPNQFACIFVDITERVNMYKSLEELTRNLEEKVRDEVEKGRKQEAMLLQQSKLAAMGEMLISISHHWRQPLNAIGLIAQSLEDYYEMEKLDRERIRWVTNNIMERLNSLSETINSFSDYLNRSQVSDSFEVCKALQDTIRMVSEDMKSNTIDCEFICCGSRLDIFWDHQCQCCQSEHRFIIGNINHFHQALLSIITNAKEAILNHKKTYEGSYYRGLIRILLDFSPREVVIRIEDDGGGIPEGLMDRIFEPYFTTKEKSYTMGLGLYLTKLIVEEQMGGRISAENTNKGAAFTTILTKED